MARRALVKKEVSLAPPPKKNTEPRKNVVKRDSEAFTLIELLVAITILGALTAICDPGV